MIMKEQLLSYPDGTWIKTDLQMTKILETEPMDAPRQRLSKEGSVFGIWWRRKQLIDQLGIHERGLL